MTPAHIDALAEQTPLDLPLLHRGKVRGVYELPSDTAGPRVLMVASDRISAFDAVMPTLIPGKGRLLTDISARWFQFIQVRRLAETHLLSTAVEDVPPAAYRTLAAAVGEPEAANWLRGRVTIARRCRVIPIECVVRGYLEGSGWAEYQATGKVCGVELPPGLKRCDRLPRPIFSPATKAHQGHDENITFEHAADLVGIETIGALRELSLVIYHAAAHHALARGIIIADTKFEFGLTDDAARRSARTWEQPILADEALTPDSSRFWPADRYTPGRPQPSFDKQYLREYLQGLVAAGQWDKSPPGPELPPAVVQGILARYAEARDRLFGDHAHPVG